MQLLHDVLRRCAARGRFTSAPANLRSAMRIADQRQAEHIDTICSGPFQGLCRSGDRRPGGDDVVDQNNITSRQAVGGAGRHGERSSDIAAALLARQSDLAGGGTRAAQRERPDRNVALVRYGVSENLRLIKPPCNQTKSPKRNRHDGVSAG